MTYEALVLQAKEAMKHSYSPYSKFRVGAALQASSGKVYGGCNVENVSYGGTICGERTALVKAVSEGERSFKAIAIVGVHGDFLYPCGFCRQLLAEFGLDLKVVVDNGKTQKIHVLRDLLPEAFTEFQPQDSV